MKRANVIPPRQGRGSMIKTYMLECFYNGRVVIKTAVARQEDAQMLKRKWEAGATQAEMAELMQSKNISIKQ